MLLEFTVELANFLPYVPFMDPLFVTQKLLTELFGSYKN